MTTMIWTTEQKLDYLRALPWTLSLTDAEEGGFVARIAELPGIIGMGDDERELHADLSAALVSALEVLLMHGDPIALPPNTGPLPWLSGVAPKSGGGSLVRAAMDRLTFGDIRTRSLATSTYGVFSQV